jgi:hypothetical protein
MNERPQLVVSVTCGDERVELRRRVVGDDQVIYEAIRKGESVGELAALGAFVPALALISGWLALWAGAQLLVVRLATGSRATCETREDIISVFPLGDGWCLVTEIGVELRTLDLLQVVARYEHADVILEAHIESGDVVLKDFDGSEVRLDGSELTPIR